MKVEIREKADGVKYPRLMIHKEMNYLVLFNNESSGMVVYSPDGNAAHAGNYSEYWDPTLFRPFNGEITLKND